MKVQRSDGDHGSRMLRVVEADGREVSLVDEPAGIAIYHGRREVVAFGISHRAALRLGLFLVLSAVHAWWRNRRW